MKKAFIIVMLLVSGATLAFGMLRCPVDNTAATATGNTRQEMGKQMAEYKCLNDHVYWVVIR